MDGTQRTFRKLKSANINRNTNGVWINKKWKRHKYPKQSVAVDKNLTSSQNIFNGP